MADTDGTPSLEEPLIVTTKSPYLSNRASTTSAGFMSTIVFVPFTQSSVILLLLFKVVRHSGYEPSVSILWHLVFGHLPSEYRLLGFVRPPGIDHVGDCFENVSLLYLHIDQIVLGNASVQEVIELRIRKFVSRQESEVQQDLEQRRLLISC